MRKRRTRSRVHGLPSHGIDLDKHLSRLLGMSLASFRFAIERNNVPHQKIGPVMAVPVVELHKLMTGGGPTMKTHDSQRLPQSGFILDEEWADALGVSIKTFRENLVKNWIPFLRYGNAYIIRDEEFYAKLREISPFGDGPS